MTFNVSGLDRLAIAIDGIEWWDYRTTDTLATVAGAGYFNSYAPYFNLNDKILVTGSDGINMYYVSALTRPLSAQGVTTTTGAASVTITALNTTPAAGSITGTMIANATITGTNIASNTVANSNLANMATGTMKARESAGSGAPEDVTYPIPIPQGRITLSTGVPIMLSTVSGATTVYYTPAKGSQVPIYNGTNFVPTTFSELSQATTDATKSPAAVAASSNYDIFVWNDGGTIRATRGPAWTSDTARGTGAGTTELTLLSGFLVNANAITNGPSANLGTYVGSIRSNGSSTIDFIYGGSSSGGTAAVLNVWNYYNRVQIATTVIDSGASYNLTSATVRVARASSGNKINFISGFQEDSGHVIYSPVVSTAAAASAAALVFIGINSTVGATGSKSFLFNPTAAAGQAPVKTSYVFVPSLGNQYVAALEGGDGTNSNNFNSNSTNSLFLSFAM